MAAEQSDGLELVGRLPVQSFLENRPQLGPSVQHPLAAACRRLQAQHHALGVFGIVDNFGFGNQGHARGIPVLFPIVMRVICQRAAIV